MLMAAGLVAASLVGSVGLGVVMTAVDGVVMTAVDDRGTSNREGGRSKFNGGEVNMNVL